MSHRSKSHMSLFTLGSLRIEIDGQSLTHFRTNLVPALLVYLAVEDALHGPQPHRRDTIIDLLWPGLPDKSARANLRQNLYLLRKTIADSPLQAESAAEVDEFLLGDYQALQINPNAAYDLDVADFIYLLQSTQSHEHLNLTNCPTCQQQLQTAVSLYQGPFLADFYLPDSDGFEDWAYAVREKLQCLVLDALEMLTAVYINQNNFTQAEQTARRQLEIDWLRESAYRQLMALMARSGRRGEALAEYETCQKLMREELGMAPSAKTSGLYEKILAGDLNLLKKQDPSVRGYDLHEQIGKGSYGSVYRASQYNVGREVAIKVIQPQYANHPDFICRFESEAQLVARLEHPYIVPLYDYWREPDGAYLVMRWLRGGSLQDRLTEGGLDLETAVTFIEQIAAALTAAHSQGVVHRDIKPANILLDEDGNAYLSDFGIAIDVERQLGRPHIEFAPSSPQYISPEQLLNEPVTPLTDLYNLGLVLYEMLSGRHPFADDPLDLVIKHHLRDPLPRLQNQRDDIPKEVDAVIQRATAKQPSARYPDAQTLAAAFRSAVLGSDLTRKWETTTVSQTDLANPYKGLQAFQEGDAGFFFGRTKFVNQLLSRLAAASFLAIVGPSGSGKSSAAKAGVLPALRQGALPGSENWFIVVMSPGAEPLQELQTALTPIAVDPPPNLLEPLQKDAHGLTRVLQRILPSGQAGTRNPVLLLIDQFEELFTLVEKQADRDHFLANLLTALAELRGQLKVMVTLRADFYDRPLQIPALGELLRRQTEVVLPLTAAELEEVICNPAAAVGVMVEPQLLATIIADVQDQPGTLPLLQYALTELFEQRRGSTMTLAAYEQIGGITGALSRRAEALYAKMDAADQEAARQLFLRLVTLGEGVEDTRRRVSLAEFDLLNFAKNSVNPHTEIIERYGRYRLLTFDRDPASRLPTIEIAHESLLSAWPRLYSWLDKSRADVRQQRLLASATAEWMAAGQDADYLLRGAHLDQLSGWAENSSVALTQNEQNFLEASLAARKSRAAAEADRRQRELETAQQLAATEGQRAEEQAQSNRRLRMRAFFLTGALLVAAVLAVLAITAGRQATQNAAIAATRETEAVIEAQQRATAESIAISERAEAQAQARQAQARALAGAAVKNLQIDPELSVLLALQAVETTHAVDNSWVPEAVDALHQAISTASRLQGVFIHEGGAMNNIIYSPDGSLLGASTLLADQPIMTTVWRTATGEKLFTLPTSIMTFSPDSMRLLTWYVDQNQNLVLTQIDAASGEEIDSIKLKIDNIAGSIGGTISFDWRYSVIRYWDGTVDVWNTSTEEKVLHLTEHEDMINSVEYSPDGQYLASADIAGKVKLWQMPAKEMQELTKLSSLLTFSHDASVETMAIRSDNRYLATISNDYTVTVWDIPASISAQEPILFSAYPLVGHAERISQIIFNRQGTLLAAVSKDGLVRVWDALSGSELLTLVSNKHTRHIAFSPDGTHLVTANDGGLVQIWDVTPAGEVELLTINDLDGGVNQIAYSPDGSQLATAGSDGQAKIWDAKTGALLTTLSGHQAAVRAVAFSPNGTTLATASNDGTIKLWETAFGRELASIPAYADLPMNPIPENNNLGLTFTPDGTHLAAVGMSPVPRVWDVAAGKSVMAMYGHDYNVPAVAMSRDGSQIATVGVEGQVIVWDGKTGRQILAQPTSIYGSLDVAFGPNGRFLVTADDDGVARVWDMDAAAGERLVFALAGHGAAVRAVAFSGDGRFIATSSAKLTRIWDAQTGQQLYTLPGHTRVITDIKFSPDSRHLASSSADGTVRVYVLPVDELMQLARSRLTRSLTDQECQQYLHVERCSN